MEIIYNMEILMYSEIKSMSCKNYLFQAQQTEMIHEPGNFVVHSI